MLMKKIRVTLSFFFVVILCTLALDIKAQDYSTTNLHVVYIDHETTTPVSRLNNRLSTLRRDLGEVNDALIVYLANGSSPLVSLLNLPDATGRNRDKEDAMNAIYDALQNVNSHNIIEREDRRLLLRLFDEFNFVDENGQLRFRNVTIDFYVGPSFWALGYEKIISHLYVVLGIAKFPKERFAFNIFKPKGVNLGYPEGKPFGDANIDGINQKLSIFEY